MFNRTRPPAQSSQPDGARRPSRDEKTQSLPRHRPHHEHSASNTSTGHAQHGTGWIQPQGESGRRFFHPLKFLRLCFRSSSRLSMAVNVLWPVVPAAIAVHFAIPENHTAIFTLNYIAMVPAANLIGFAGQELSRKLPHVLGVLIETTFGSVVEIILFSVLVAQRLYDVTRAAILGSILANLLFCLGICFVAGGFDRREQKYHEVVSEVGSGLMLVAGTAFASATSGASLGADGALEDADAENRLLSISRATAILAVIAYATYVYFNMSSHHGLVAEVYQDDELRDRDRHKDLSKDKLTMTECILALAISIACVSMIAVFLVLEIEPIIEHSHISDAFMGLILVPIVEKLAEHLTAIDEAFDGMPNMALAHVLGASLQTALLNTPIAVFVGWGLGANMDLNFRSFEAILLILTILVVGNFLRDGKTNYLEGALMVFVYINVAVCAWYYPNEGGH